MIAFLARGCTTHGFAAAASLPRPPMGSLLIHIAIGLTFFALIFLRKHTMCTTLVKPSTSCSLIVHQGSLTLSDFIIRLKLISIPGLSFIVVNVICNWWRSCHWEMWLSAGFDVGLNGTMAVLVSFCMASSSSYCFGLNFELLTFIYCVWLSTKKSRSFELGRLLA